MASIITSFKLKFLKGKKKKKLKLLSSKYMMLTIGSGSTWLYGKTLNLPPHWNTPNYMY